jgi:hypothetical protein
LERILGIVRAAEKTPADTPNHRSMPPHQSGKDGLVPLAEKAAQQFSVRQSGSISYKDRAKMPNNFAHLVGRHLSCSNGVVRLLAPDREAIRHTRIDE